MATWRRVSASSPCPICHHGDWCRVTADGALAGCMRVQTGSVRSRTGRDGSTVYLHRLTDGPRRAPEPESPARSAAQRAGVETLNVVYADLLGRLSLSDRHRQSLHQRGLTDAAIDRGGYRSLPVQGRARLVLDLHQRHGDRLLSVPGIVSRQGQSGDRYLTLRGPAGLIVPCRDQAGRVVALKVRRDGNEPGRPRYCYVSSAGHGGPGPGAPVHHPVGTPATAGLVRLTEGEIKADVVWALTGVSTLSIPGVSTWRAALPSLSAMGCVTVRMAWDSDAWDSAAVARTLSACADALIAAGHAVELERWDAAAGKGLDDLLAAGGDPEVLAGDAALSAIRDALASATAGEDVPPPDELARLRDVLDAGGAEALYRDRPLLKAIAALGEVDPAGYAAVRAAMRGRVSLRDLDRALRPYRRRESGGDAPPYHESGGCTYRLAQTRDGPVPVALANFVGRIVEDVAHDDGAEQTRYLAVEGTLHDGAILPRVEVPADQWPRMEWITPSWGTRAVVMAGASTRDHLRVALQTLSGDVPRRTVYAHLGWRRIGQDWHYLHAGGAIGPAGLAADVPVSLPESLSGYRLPAPPSGGDLARAIRASLGLLRLGPDRLTYPLLAAVYRAALGDTDFALHLAGQTGTYKSEAAALAQQHYGAGMDARHLPASWASTGNALEGLAFSAKDALLVVDDFCPTGSAADIQRHHREADRLLRGQGNHSGRLRMRADASLRPARPPRGLVMSTGEDVPRGQSLRARMLVLDVSPGDFGPAPPAGNPVLSAAQADASAGLFAQSLSGYLGWLAPQMDAIRGRLRAELAGLREQARADGQHARTPGIVADLALGLRYLLDYATTAGAVTTAERDALWARGWTALTEAARAQAASVAAAEPAGQYQRLLSAALAGGYAHVASEHGDAPAEPERWGWRREEYRTSEGTDAVHRPQGVRVGWLAGGELYLEPDASYAVAQRLAREQGETLPVSAATLRQRLRDRGLLATADTSRGRLTVRRTLQGVRREVLHIAMSPAGSVRGTDAAAEDSPSPSAVAVELETANAGTRSDDHPNGWGDWR